MSTHICEPLLNICPDGRSANLAKGESVRARAWGSREHQLRCARTAGRKRKRCGDGTRCSLPGIDRSPKTWMLVPGGSSKPP